jgi:hypothetical protein
VLNCVYYDDFSTLVCDVCGYSEAIDLIDCVHSSDSMIDRECPICRKQDEDFLKKLREDMNVISKGPDVDSDDGQTIR